MAMLLTMQVGPVQWDQFKLALEWLYAQDAPGWISSKVYRSEKDPSMVLFIDEWESHDAMHAFVERVEAEFHARAGTGALSWHDGTWTLSDAPSRGAH
jgi:quinol monooxygenase YgiN